MSSVVHLHWDAVTQSNPEFWQPWQEHGSSARHRRTREAKGLLGDQSTWSFLSEIQYVAVIITVLTHCKLCFVSLLPPMLYQVSN